MNGTSPSPKTAQIVLVTAHDGGLRSALEFLLRVEGYDVQTAGSGEALLELRLSDPGCLVIDQDLPALSGLQTIEILRGRGVDLPAVLLAGRPQDVAWLVDRQPAVQIVEKPLVDSALLEAIAHALG